VLRLLRASPNGVPWYGTIRLYAYDALAWLLTVFNMKSAFGHDVLAFVRCRQYDLQLEKDVSWIKSRYECVWSSMIRNTLFSFAIRAFGYSSKRRSRAIFYLSQSQPHHEILWLFYYDVP
jgi:hypothetical protein